MQSAKQYKVSDVEKKWQNRWQNNPDGCTTTDYTQKKFYCLDMFPYPSGSGLHVGHWRGYVLSDVYARIKWLQGYAILHPMGWDAFGLPAENDALKKGIHPEISTAKNIATFKTQLQQVGALYDWTKELNTTDPDFYKWTQWIFIKMFKAGLAYQSNMPINWCPSCKTGLANEEVVAGCCERCSTAVTKKNIPQWVLKITAYAEKLLNDLDTLDWPEKVKLMQKNWIGKSEGLLFSSKVKDSNIVLETFSAHFMTCFADTFFVIAPDHPLLPTLIQNAPNKTEIQDFCAMLLEKRMKYHNDQTTELEGIFTGVYVINPLDNKELPLWVASFVLADYGTGIVKCSAHDPRDFAFAQKYNIPLTVGLVPANDEEVKAQVLAQKVCYTDMQAGMLLLPQAFAGKIAGDVKDEFVDYLESQGFVKRTTSYRLRDWIFSRQRYWGEPIPLIHCTSCGVVPVPEAELPVLLPEVEKYEPTGTGESPLAAITEWVNVPCPACKGAAKRETNTMPQWAGSSWYFLRYPNPSNNTELCSKKDTDYWLPVDLYVGGIEHAILHLLYARFYVKFLHDYGYLSFNEPFTRLFNQGMVCKYSEKSGHVEKMSKSKGNVVNPDEIVKQYGSDVLRMYMLFMGPPELDCEWQDTGLEGIKRFAQKVTTYCLNTTLCKEADESKEAKILVHQFLKTFQDRLNHFKPNTALAAFMEFFNALQKQNVRLSQSSIIIILTSLSIFAPHMASELLEQVCEKKLRDCTWPTYDPDLAQETSIELGVQVNGKIRAHIKVSAGATQEEVQPKAEELIAEWIKNKKITKIIFVPNRLISFVVV